MKKLITIALLALALLSCGGYEEEWLEESPELKQIDTPPDGLLPNEKDGWIRRPELDPKRPPNDLLNQERSFKK